MVNDLNNEIYSIQEALAYSEVSWNNILIQAIKEEYSATLNEDSKVITVVKDFFNNVIDWFKNLFTRIVTFFSNVVKSIKKYIKDFLNIRKIKSKEIENGSKIIDSAQSDEEDSEEVVNKFITLKHKNRTITFDLGYSEYYVSLFKSDSIQEVFKMIEYIYDELDPINPKFLYSSNDDVKGYTDFVKGFAEFIEKNDEQFNKLSTTSITKKHLTAEKALNFADKINKDYSEVFDKYVLKQEKYLKEINDNCQKQCNDIISKLNKAEENSYDDYKKRHSMICLTVSKNMYTYLLQLITVITSYYNRYVLPVTHGIYKECLRFYNKYN